MKQTPPTPDGSALLTFIAEALQRQLESDPSLQAATAGLRRAGMSVVLRLELATGEPMLLKVVVNPRPTGVPQWTSEDRELLASLGIASDGDDQRRRQAKPGWR